MIRELRLLGYRVEPQSVPLANPAWRAKCADAIFAPARHTMKIPGSCREWIQIFAKHY
jgi:hypothetical protein